MDRILKITPYAITSITYLFMHMASCCNLIQTNSIASILINIQTIYYTTLFVFMTILYTSKKLRREYAVSVIMNFLVFTIGINNPELKYLPYAIGNALLVYLHFQ